MLKAFSIFLSSTKMYVKISTQVESIKFLGLQSQMYAMLMKQGYLIFYF